MKTKNEEGGAKNVDRNVDILFLLLGLYMA